MYRILLIEDDDSVRENVQILLEEENFKVQAVDNGIKGIECAKKNLPDLIICDIMLPDINGYAILEELNKHPKARIIPFVYLTAKVEIADIRKGMNLGAEDYVTKPFNSQDLINVIKTRIRKKELLQSSTDTALIKKQETKVLDLNDHIFIHGVKDYHSIIVKDIVCIISEGVYTNVFTRSSSKLLIRKLLKDWEETLPESSFIRIHKSAIINLIYVKKLEKWFNNSYRLHLESIENPLVVSRRFSSKLRASLIF